MAEVQRGWAGAVWVLNAIWEQVFRDFVPGTGWSLRLGCAEGGSSPWWEVRAVPHPGRHTLALGCPAAEQQEKPSWQAQSQCQSKRKTNKQTNKEKQAKPTETAGSLVRDPVHVCPVKLLTKGKRGAASNPAPGFPQKPRPGSWSQGA